MRTALLSFVLLAPYLALAQEGGKAPAADKAVAKIHEVERGLYVGVDAGALYLLKPTGVNSAASPGRVLALGIGYDMGNTLSLGILAWSGLVDMPSRYQGTSGGVAKGDFSTWLLALNARLSLAGLSDANGVRRTWFYLRLAGGYGLIRPKELLEPGTEAVAMGGLGVEYFTHLRHFSVGLELDGLYGPKMGPGISFAPTLRYSF